MIPRTKVNYTLGELLGSIPLMLRSAPDWHERLIDRLRERFGMQHILLMPSGRAGLYFILRTLEQSRVIIPAYTCKAVVEAALLAGKEIVYVETESGGFNMDAEEVRRQADADSIIIATHQFGIPCAIDTLVAIAGQCGAVVVEDAAASFGSRYHGRLTGTFGDAAFFSFDSTKTINIPLKGGFILTRQEALLDRIRQLYANEIRPMPRSVQIRHLLAGSIYLVLENRVIYRIFHTLHFAWRGRFTADSPDLDRERSGYYRHAMSDWQARLAVLQLDRCEAIFRVRRTLYQRYWQTLQSCRAFELPPPDTTGQWVCTRFPIRVRGDKLAFYRACYRQGVDMAFSFTFIASPAAFEQSHDLARSVLDIPYYFKLDEVEFQQVVRILRKLSDASDSIGP